MPRAATRRARRKGGSRCPGRRRVAAHWRGCVVTAYTGQGGNWAERANIADRGRAEELRVPVASVRFIMGDTALTPFDGARRAARPRPICGRRCGGRRHRARDADGPWRRGSGTSTARSFRLPTARRPPASRSAGFGRTDAGAKARPDDRGECAADAGRRNGRWRGPRCPKSRPRDRDRRDKYPPIRRGMLYGKILYPPHFARTGIARQWRRPPFRGEGGARPSWLRRGRVRGMWWGSGARLETYRKLAHCARNGRRRPRSHRAATSTLNFKENAEGARPRRRAGYLHDCLHRALR